MLIGAERLARTVADIYTVVEVTDGKTSGDAETESDMARSLKDEAIAAGFLSILACAILQ